MRYSPKFRRIAGECMQTLVLWQLLLDLFLLGFELV